MSELSFVLDIYGRLDCPSQPYGGLSRLILIFVVGILVEVLIPGD